jgi:hypothetical protein
MRRAWVAAVGLLTACGAAGPVQCGACAGPGYVFSGLPERSAPARVTECLAGMGCVRHRVTFGPDLRLSQQPLTMLYGTRWDDVDGATLTVTVRTRDSVYRGQGALQLTPGGDGPCDCGTLSADVPLTRVSRPG